MATILNAAEQDLYNNIISNNPDAWPEGLRRRVISRLLAEIRGTSTVYQITSETIARWIVRDRFSEPVPTTPIPGKVVFSRSASVDRDGRFIEIEQAVQGGQVASTPCVPEQFTNVSRDGWNGPKAWLDGYAAGRERYAVDLKNSQKRTAELRKVLEDIGTELRNHLL